MAATYAVRKNCPAAGKGGENMKHKLVSALKKVFGIWSPSQQRYRTEHKKGTLKVVYQVDTKGLDKTIEQIKQLENSWNVFKEQWKSKNTH